MVKPMVVEVRLFATFRENRFKTKEMELSADTRIAGLLKLLKIPKEHVGILLANGRSAQLDTELASKDVVSIFPAIGGG